MTAELDDVLLNYLADRARLAGEALRDAAAHWYVLSSAPSLRAKELVEASVSFFAADLGIDAPRQAWIRAVPTQEALGGDRQKMVSAECDAAGLCLTRPTGQTGPAVMIRSDLGLSPRRLIMVVAHEVRHAAGGDEDEAEAYEVEQARRLFGAAL